MQNFESLIEGKSKKELADLIVEFKIKTQTEDVKLLIQKLQQKLDE